LKRSIVFIILLLLAVQALQAQRKPCFKVYDVGTKQEINAICVGQKIKVVNCEPVSPGTIQYYDYDNRDQVKFDPQDTVNTHTFTDARTYRISFLPQDLQSTSDSTSKAFTVVPVPAPKFRVLGCSQGNVQVTITDKIYQSYLVDYGDGSTQTLPAGGRATHQYAPDQALWVKVTGRYSQALCTNFADTTVQELPLPSQPRLTKIQFPLATAAGQLAFTIDQLQDRYYYVIEKQNGAGFSVLDTIKNPATALLTKVISPVDTRSPGCYRVRVTDRCGSGLPVISNTICTVPLSISAGQAISLSWPAYPDPSQITGYQLFKNSKPYRDLPKNQLAFRDERVTCHQQNCYELVALLSNGAQSVSNNPCATVNTSLPPLQPYLTSTFTPENRVRIGFQVPASQVIKQITYQKSAGGAGFSDMGVSKTFTYEDNTFNKKGTVCYQAVYLDSCDQASPVSNQTCPIILKATQPDNGTILLTWSSYVGFPSGLAAYLVEQVDANGAVLAAVPVTGNTYSDSFSARGAQKVFYRIQATTAGQDPTYSNTESVIFTAKALIPTAFTPNGDNLNDLFEVKGRFIQVTRLTIYDRWGQIIYQSQGQGWDGSIKGQPAPAGTYPYSVTWQDDIGRVNAQKGIVSLLR
jgi:gliding motility-associated-like protein